MKITKRKWGTQQPLFFYRDMIAGRLTEQPNRQRDFADLLFEQTSVAAVFETSLQSRLLKMDDKGPKYRGDRGIIELVTSLCQSGNLSENLDKIKCLPQQGAKKLCQEALSGYGSGFTAAGGAGTLYEALLLLMTGDDAQRAHAKAELEKIQKALLEEKTNRMARVRTSIKGNKIPLQIRDGSITANTNRAAWLLELLQTNGEKSCYSALDDMEKIFPFERLADEINRKLSDCDGRPQTIAKMVDEAVRTYRRSLWDRYPEQRRDMKYYFQALQEYFKENFPIRTKREGARKRQEMLGDGTARARLLEPEHMKKAVRRRLINQSTQLHILYGKLYEYCCTGSSRLLVNSDTLQTIQVLEAVKKQAMTAILWSVSRLNYFYDYQCSGDILSNAKEQKDFRNKYLYECNEKDFEVCREKLQAFFPLEGVINREYCTALLEACTDCIRELRVRIFHFKNLSFIEVLEQATEDIDIIAKKNDEKIGKSLNFIKELYKQDLEHLQKAFMQRISSMNLPLYYPSELLLGIFANSGKCFTLYSADCQMTPSFRKVYERGINLRLNNCGLRWFRQLEDEWETAGVNVQVTADADAQRAVRNLLQLIYDYCFLPAVQENETLVTGCISEVLARNRQIANESGRPRAAGYSEIQTLYREGGPGMRLKDLMEQMQRLISQTEQENRELARDKTDYAQRFLREVYAMTFNNFLDRQYPKYCNDVVFPQKNGAVAKARIEESSLPCLHTSLTEDIGGYLLVLYPVLRLLDGQELSEFQQQMLRYRTAMAKQPDGEKLKSDIKMVEKIEELTELVKLTEPIPVNAKEAWRNRALETFSPFIEGSISEYGDFYLQSDNFTPVFHRNMTRLLRSGVLDVYKAVPGMRKQATSKDYKAVCDGQWVMQSTDERPITFVEYVQSELQRLHRKYEISRFLSKEERESYREMLRWLDNYNQARRNLTFETLYGVCRIHLETMSRWVGFAQDWERDMYFLLLAWIKQGKLQRPTEDKVNEIFDEGYVVRNLRKYLKGNDLTAFLSIYCSGADEKLKFAEVRNVIAHLDLLRRSGWESKTESRHSTVEGYLDCLDRLRILLSYDQKRMNAVTKTMQKILEEQMISAEFTMKAKGKLELERLQPMLIEHLKKSKFQDKITVPSRSETFLKTLESLIKYRKPGSLT